MNKLKVLDLFSGIGGFSLGLERTGGFETVAFCEIEDYPRKVLAKHWPEVPIFEDVRKLDATRLGRIDCVVGGFPCQPWSLAGKRKKTEDDRDLWPEMLRVITDAQPRWVIGENVRGFVNEPMGLERSISDLEDAEYKVQSFVIPACGVDAPHRRDRVWIVANFESLGHFKGRKQRDIHATDGGQVGERSPVAASASKQPEDAPNNALENAGHRRWRDFGVAERGQGLPGERASGASAPSGSGEQREALAHAKKLFSNGGDSEPRRKKSQSGNNSGATRGCAHWLPEPDVGRVAHGVPGRVDRLKGLGNAVVPQIPEMIGRAILKSYES